jgi:beta-lactamase class A
MASRARRFKGLAVAAVVLLATGFAAAAAGKPAPKAHPAAKTATAAPRVIADRITELGKAFDGRVGIAVMSIDDGWLAGWQATDLCPQQSVSKLWVAITVLDAVDRGKLKLDDPVTLTRDDLTLFHQPIAEEVLKTGSLTTTVGDLMLREITQSDNTANDKLMRLVGGPAAIRAMISHKHLGAIRFGDGERALQSKIAGQEWDPGYSIGTAGFEARDA